MTRQTSRRGFLGLSALGLAAAVTPYESTRPAATVSEFENETSRVSSEISVWVTFGDKRFAAAPKAAWRPASGTPGADQLRLNPGNKVSADIGIWGRLYRCRL